MDTRYPVNEIFYSIQGEGFNVGEPAIFIRFAGCNLKCPWCDTDHSEKMLLTVEEIMERLMPFPITVPIILTGGEPTIHDLRPLLQHICAFYKKLGNTPFFAVETNGTWDYSHPFLKCCDAGLIDWITVSPKPQKPPTACALEIASELKVVFDGVIDPTVYWCEKLAIERALFIQPCSEKYQSAVDFVLAHPFWRLSVQTQKIIGVK